MQIERKVIEKLLAWKEGLNSKPLILQGARQVGKTWLLKQFGELYFEQYAYFNFDQQIELKQFFETTKDPRRILDNLSLLYGKAIEPNSTLIIFDEIQECNNALNALKYFAEDAPEYKIACAGSLLGVAMGKGASFPVGKVDFIPIYPISFSEFLKQASPELHSYLEQINRIEPLPDIFFNQLAEKLKMYFISGGMPEAITTLLGTRDVLLTQQVLHNILTSFRLDFSKHIASKDIPKVNYIWSSLPSQLARDNKKFLYQTVKPGARARDYEDALTWLINSGLAYKVFCNTKPALPLSAYDDLNSFKIYLPDVGLLRRMSNLDPIVFADGERLFSEFKGALTENFVLSSLLLQFDGNPRFWRSGNLAEVDFIIQHHNSIIPVEVKSDKNVRSKSLAFYRKEFNPPMAIRFSMKNLKKDEGLINIPLFMVDYTRKILNQL
jgi:uncharacterized protein